MKILEHTPDEMLRYWVWLSMVFGAGSQQLLNLLRQTETPDELYDGMQAGRFTAQTPAAARAAQERTLSEADSIVYYCRSNDIRLIAADSAEYPEMLRRIAHPPVLLTAQGNLELLNNPDCISIVGTRRPSPYTERLTTKLVRELGANQFTVVSGFARGVDALAHRSALEGGGTTIAVLGCGINVNYPRENAALRDQMLSSGRGLFLSEYMPGTQPYTSNFPKRNRILSGLTPATAVMEAAERSGSLLTAQNANDQGRYVFAVPPADLFDLRYAGSVQLLRDGAFPLMGIEDVMLAYREQESVSLPERQQMRRAPEPAPRKPAAPKTSAAKNAAPPVPPAPPAAETVKKPAPPAKSAAPAAPLPEDEEGRRIVEYLREIGDTYANDLAAALDMDLSALLGALTMLELDGYVESLFGKQYRAC